MAKNEIKISANVADTVRPALAGADRHPGWHALRSIAGRITTPLLPDDYLKLANPLWSARELRGRVLEVRRETEDSATLVIKPGWGFSFDYEPGQYIGIGVLMDGRWRWRSYSLTSSPASRPAVDGANHHHHRQGDARGLPVQPPGRRPFAGHHRAAGRAAGQLRHAGSGAGLGAVPHRRIGHHARHVDAAHAGPRRADRRRRPRALGANGIRRDVRLGAAWSWQARTTVTGCGCVPRAPRAASICPGSTTKCRTGAIVRPGRAVPRACSTRPRRRGRRRASPSGCTWRGSRCRGLPVHGQGGTVEFARSGKTVTVDAATSLMDAGESVGVRMPFGCRMGICQSCVVELVDGHVRDLRSGVEHEPGNRIQTCISAASGDCVLDV